jgi:hypothetical protein
MTCTHCGSHYINSDGRCGLCARQVIHPIVNDNSKDALIIYCRGLAKGDGTVTKRGAKPKYSDPQHIAKTKAAMRRYWTRKRQLEKEAE